jgi:hypothetical protein
MTYNIIANNALVQLKFSPRLSWLEVVNSDVLPSQFTVFVKEDVSKFVGIESDKIVVRDLQAADDGGVLMTMNIPENKVVDFSNVIMNSSSPFYTEGSKLSKLVDPSAPVIAEGMYFKFQVIYLLFFNFINDNLIIKLLILIRTTRKI